MPKKILLADDSITIQKVIGLTFANEDFELTVVDNGDEAIIKAREIVPDLIIADVVMPGKDGYEVAYTTKSDPALKHVPVLLLAGTFETFDENMAKKVGADGYITKPFESQALIDKVNELIGRAMAKHIPSVTDLANDVLAPSETLDTVEAFDALDPIEAVEPIEEVSEFATLDPSDAIEPAPTEPEENPLEEFASLTPDPVESSFADLSLDDSPAPSQAAFEPTEPSFADLSDESPATTTVSAHIQNTQSVVESTDWNFSDFSDYQAQQTQASSSQMADMPAPATPATEVTADSFDELPQPMNVFEPVPVETSISPERSATIEMASVDTEMELAPETVPLERVAEMYPLESDESAAPPSPAPDPSAAPQNQPVAPAGLADLVETKVRAALADENRFAVLSAQVGRMIEEKIDEVIARLAPELVERIVKKALADATERVLHDTMNRLRNG